MGLFDSLFDRVARAISSDPAQLKAEAETKASKLSPDQAREQFDSIVNKRPTKGPGNFGDLPYVPPPPAFRPMPEIQGGSLQKPVEDLFKLAPEARGSFSKISVIPPATLIEDIIDAGYNPGDFQQMNVLGQTDYSRSHKSPVIYINPSGSNRGSTVVHEAAHAQGGDEATARLSQALLERFQPTKR